MQPTNISEITCRNKKWCFTFVNETDGVFTSNGDIFGGLKKDFEGTPILVGLTEKKSTLPYIHTTGKKQNIWINEI